MTTTIDHLAYPHIFDLIVSYATLWPDPCFNLRALCRHLKDRIDAQLCSNVYVEADEDQVSNQEAQRELDVILHGNLGPLPRHQVGYTPNGVNFRAFVEAIYTGTPRPWQRLGSDCATGSADGFDSGQRRLPGMKWKGGSAAERAECLRLLRAHTTVLAYSGAEFSVPSLSEAPIFAALNSERIRMVRGGGNFPNGMHNVRMAVMFATLSTPMYFSEGPYITFIQRVPEGVDKLVAPIRFDPRDPRIPAAQIQIDLGCKTLRELVLVFIPREVDEDFDVPDADLAALRDTRIGLPPTQPFGMLDDVIMAVAYNLKDIRWTMVGHDQLGTRPDWIGMGDYKWPFHHSVVERRFRATVEACVRRDEREFAKWTDDGLQQAVRAIRMVPTFEYIDEVGEDEFDLLTEQ